MRLIYKIVICALLAGITGCKKETTQTTSKSVVIVASACSNMGSIQDTITESGQKYHIVATSGANNVLGIELVTPSGIYPSSLTVNLLQVQNGTNCFESSNVTNMIGSQYKTYLFGSFPTWAIDTNTVSIVKLTMNSNVYYLRDRKLNK